MSPVELIRNQWTLTDLAAEYRGRPADELGRLFGRWFFVGTTPTPAATSPRHTLHAEQGEWEEVPNTEEADADAGRDEQADRVPSLGSGVVVFALRPQRRHQEPTLLVGRDGACDILLDHHSVSRNHASLFVKADTVAVLDLGSSNGTYVGAVRVPTEGGRPMPVSAGQQISFGDITLSLVAPTGLVALLGAT